MSLGGGGGWRKESDESQDCENIDVGVEITGTSYLRLLPFGFACCGSWS